MRFQTVWMLSVVLILVTGGCLPDAPDLPDEVVAQVDGYRLTVAETAEMAAGFTFLPPEGATAESLANLWVDFTLLADEMARDSTLQSVDLSPVLDASVRQRIILELRDRAVEVDTAFTEEELREIFRRELPGTRVRARHILLRVPQGAAPAEREAVRARAQELRDRVLAGEDMAGLAREHSEDAETAAGGGDTGELPVSDVPLAIRQELVELEPGELAPVVESPVGFHVLRLEERAGPEYEEVREQFREDLRRRRVVEAESTYIAGVEEGRDVRIPDEAVGRARELIRDYDAGLGWGAGREILAEYQGGRITASRFHDFLLSQPRDSRQQLAEAPDENLVNLLRNMVRQELLLEEADEMGISVGRAARDSIAEGARLQAAQAARVIGLHPLEVLDGESRQEAVARLVRERLRSVLVGDTQAYSSGLVGPALEAARRPRFNPDAFPRVADRIRELREAEDFEPFQREGPEDPGGG